MGQDPREERLIEERRERRSRAMTGRERLSRWCAALAFAAVAAGLAATAPDDGRTVSAVSAVLVLLYAIASRIEFEIGSGSALPTQLVFVPMLFEIPAGLVPAAVAIGFVAGGLPSFVRRDGLHPERVAALIGNAWYSVAPAAVFVAAGQPHAGAQAVPWLLAAVAAQFAGDFVLTVVREWTALRVPPASLVAPFAWIFAVDALLTPVGFGLALAAAAWAPAILCVLPLLILIRVFARERRERLGQTLELSHAYRGTVFLLGDLVEADDEYTGTHSRAVVDLVLATCDRLGVDATSRRNAEFVALLHDIGKIRIPKSIINKPGPLNAEEWAIVRTHTIEGQRLLERIGGLLAEIGWLVRSCHERWDGAGYPDGLAGDEIPIIARIVYCCDAFNAMTTPRPYRPACSVDDALEELRRNAGTQFDPAVVAAVEAAIASSAAAELDPAPASLVAASRRAPAQRTGTAVVLAATVGDAALGGRGDSTTFGASGVTDLRKPA